MNTVLVWVCGLCVLVDREKKVGKKVEGSAHTQQSSHCFHKHKPICKSFQKAMVANSNRVPKGAHHQTAVYTGMYTMNPKPYIMSGLTAEPVRLAGLLE